ncbi:ECF-type sigma factor [Roseimaritima sediminicola]|uniref:ECF-type sigma factor n=1 Tax=Roseimaritima sediminicola TaxID=2662066 RepID=UPI0012984732|nr:ECF-type sigma factor [Roseimaritima sediminicola]
MSDVAQLLTAAASGNAQAAEQLLSAVYEDLRRLARSKMAGERSGHSLQATDLVHESFIRLIDAERRNAWQTRAHFFAAAAEAMRWILVDHARRRATAKRGGDLRRVAAEPDALPSVTADEDQILAVHEALDRLAAEAPQQAELVKLRYFAGLTLEQAATALNISRATASRHWKFAKAWLAVEVLRDQ